MLEIKLKFNLQLQFDGRTHLIQESGSAPFFEVTAYSISRKIKGRVYFDLPPFGASLFLAAGFFEWDLNTGVV